MARSKNKPAPRVRCGLCSPEKKCHAFIGKCERAEELLLIELLEAVVAAWNEWRACGLSYKFHHQDIHHKMAAAFSAAIAVSANRPVANIISKKQRIADEREAEHGESTGGFRDQHE